MIDMPVVHQVYQDQAHFNPTVTMTQTLHVVRRSWKLTRYR